MNYSDFESEIDPRILERGKDYTLKGLVQDLTKEGGHWYATVDGTHSYEVVIKGIRKIQYWECDCPYDQGPICKHVVATMYAIREQMAADRINKPKQKKKGKKPIDEIFNNAEPADLLQFFKKNLRYHKTLKQKLLTEFLHTIGDADPDRYRRVVEDMLRNIRSAYGYIEFRAAKQLSQAFDRLLNQAQAAFQQQNYLDALGISQAIMEQLPTLLLTVDDSSAYLQGNFYDGSQIILRLLEAPIAPMFRDQVFEAVLTIYKVDQFGFDLSKDLLASIIPYDWEEEQYQQLEDILVKELHQLTGNHVEYEQPFYVSTLSDLYDQLKATDKKTRLLQKYIHLPKARASFLEDLLEKEDYPAAKQLLEEGIQLAKAQGHPGTVKRWQDLEMEISKRTGDPQALQKQLSEAFLRFKDISYFSQLKTVVPQEQWEEVKNQFVETFRKGDQYAHSQESHAIANIFIHEEEWEKLLKYVLKKGDNPHHNLNNYAQYLDHRYPDEMLALYKPRILHQAFSAHQRSDYRKVAHRLKALLEIKGGRTVVEELLQVFRAKYSNRPAMMDELSGVL